MTTDPGVRTPVRLVASRASFLLIGRLQHLSRPKHCQFLAEVHTHVTMTSHDIQPCRGLTKNAFYLASGRGSGLEHRFMDDLFSHFYHTHWRAAFVIFWMGVATFALSRDFIVFLVYIFSF
jgi:hypothetical protein